MEHSGLEERILSHDKQLVKLETVLERVANNQDRMSDSIEKLALSMSKLANYEENHKSSFERVHKRIDESISIAKQVDENSKERKKKIDERLDKINFVFVAMQYPRLVFFSILGLYFMAISDVRNTLFKLIGLL